jgi:hypothetical protein
MSQAIRVTAPYVMLKVKDRDGQMVIAGFYEGAVVESVDPESRQHHLDSGMAEEVKDPEPEPEPEPESKSPATKSTK